MKYDPITLKRHELLDALRGFVSPKKYQAMCYQPTSYLRGILLVLQCPESEHVAPEKPVREITMTLTEFFETFTDDEIVAMMFPPLAIGFH